jgi:hypothetical protein
MLRSSCSSTQRLPDITDDPRIELLQFTAEIDGDVPRFDYKLRPGVSTQRLGMTLLRQEHVLDLLDNVSVDQASGASILLRSEAKEG